MALALGTTIGHYSVDSLIGSGGMGEVYLAFDGRLDRYVALKILPPALVSNPERVRRFTLEAKAASALHHPTIVSIYEIGQDIAEGETVQFLAMELVQGETLRAMSDDLRRDPGKCLELMAQVADGLTTAHAAGIVHRDIKPENIMVTADGYVKILDFGLAKLVARDSLDGASATTALKDQETASGTVLGTAAYMAPEQALGAPVDHRSDIFSLGCVLYELVAGVQPFKGRSPIETMANIAYEPPAPLPDSDAYTARDLARIVRKCLAKNPGERYQSMRDVALDLREVARDSESASRQPWMAVRSRRGSRALAAATVAFIFAAVLLLWLWPRGQAQSASISAPASVLPKMSRLATPGPVQAAALSPDGRYFVFALAEGGRQSLWVKQIATDSNVQILPASEMLVRTLRISSDGNYVLYSATVGNDPNQDIFRIPLLGGAKRRLIAGVTSRILGSADFDVSPATSMIAFARTDPKTGDATIFTASADGTNERVLTTLKRAAIPQAIAWLPGGDRLAVVADSEGQPALQEIDLRTGAATTRDRRWTFVTALTYLPDGSGAVISGSGSVWRPWKIWFVPRGTADPRPLTSDVGWYASASLSGDGKMLLSLRGEAISNVHIFSIERNGIEREVTRGRNLFGRYGLAWSGNDDIIATARGKGTESRLVRISLSDGSVAEIVGTNSSMPALAPDGVTVAFTSVLAPDRKDEVWISSIDGTGVRQLPHTRYSDSPSYTPDGKTIVFSSYKPAHVALRISLDGSLPVRVTKEPTRLTKLSPDGRFLLARQMHAATAGPAWRTAVIPFDSKGATRYFDEPQIESRFETIGWHPDSRHFTYVKDAKGVHNVYLQSIDGGGPRQVTRFDSGKIYSFAWSPDGKRIALARGESTREAMLLSDFR